MRRDGQAHPISSALGVPTRLTHLTSDGVLPRTALAAGLPILHVSVQHAYAPADLRGQIYGHLNTGARAEVSV